MILFDNESKIINYKFDEWIFRSIYYALDNFIFF